MVQEGIKIAPAKKESWTAYSSSVKVCFGKPVSGKIPKLSHWANCLNKNFGLAVFEL